MSEPFGPDKLTAAQLRELLVKASAQNLDTAEEIEPGIYQCPVCDEGSVEGKSFINYDGVPLSVQFFGIGDEHVAAEALFRAAIRALPALLDAVERKQEGLAAVLPDRAPARDTPDPSPQRDRVCCGKPVIVWTGNPREPSHEECCGNFVSSSSPCGEDK